MTDPISAIGSVNAASELRGIAPEMLSSQRPFDLMEKFVGEVNNSVSTADTKVRELALGRTDNLHDVMISLESARLSMGLLVQVRNRVVDAYQDLMRMQI
jgi:flagellar hook-basal body complex protein FliE